MKVIKIIFLVLVINIGIVGCVRTLPVENPNFSVTNNTREQTATAIKKALQGRTWVLLKESPGRFVAQYTRGLDTSATIQIDYTKNDVSIKLVDSANLMHGIDKQGNEVIHKTYIRWIENLKRDILFNASYK